ncbi:hypothetical protein BGZ97_005659, partial [Linnemannia gamsii]
MSTYNNSNNNINNNNNNNNDIIQDVDDAQRTSGEAEETTEQEQSAEAEAPAVKSSPDLTLPVEQVTRTKRTSMELSQWRSDMSRTDHTTD